jgi:O-methyltransferase
MSYKKIKKIMRHFLPNKQAIRRKKIHRKFKEFTMISENIYISNLELAESISNVNGCIVECGVWKGGMCAGISSILGPSRKYYLFDSFEGLPPARDIDGTSAIVWQGNTEAPEYCDNCTATKETAAKAMNIANTSNYELVAGWFNETLPKFDLHEPIALLRLDGDWYDSTMVCLVSLFDKVQTGGLIIIDDYHTWDGCSRAVHDFLSCQSAVERIDCYKGVCFIRKK